MFPASLFYYKEDGSQSEVVGALRVTRKRVLYSDSGYRDSFNAAFMGAAIPNAPSGGDSVSGAGLAGPTVTTTAYLTQIPTSIAPAASTTAVSFSDEIGHYPWRAKQYVRWLKQWWDAATPGLAMSGLTVTTVTGSTSVTVPNSQLLTPGQAITSANFPAGTIIMDTLPISNGLPDATTIVISQAATATSSVIATTTGANLLAEIYEDEWVDWAESISFPT